MMLQRRLIITSDEFECEKQLNPKKMNESKIIAIVTGGKGEGENEKGERKKVHSL